MGGGSAQSGGSREWILMTSLRQRKCGRILSMHLPPPLPPSNLRSSPPPSCLSFTYGPSARNQPVFTGFVSHWLWLISRWQRVEEPNVAMLKTEIRRRRQPPTAVCRTNCIADKSLHSQPCFANIMGRLQKYITSSRFVYLFHNAIWTILCTDEHHLKKFECQ